MIRNSYEPPGHSLRLDGKKVQQLVDDYVRSLNIEDIMDPREVTYNNILGYVSKFKTESPNSLDSYILKAKGCYSTSKC